MTYDIPPFSTPDSAPIVAPDLSAQLATGGAVDVLVTFLDLPSAAELTALGLRRRGPMDAQGELDARAVANLERRPDVASIGLAPRPAAPPRPSKVDPELAAQLAAQPDSEALVAVWFSALPDHATLTELGLLDTGGNPATGRLNRTQVEALSRRDDVDRVNLRPQMDPS